MAVKPNKNPQLINECKEALLNAIRDSHIYQRYEAARIEIEKDPQQLLRVNDFRKRAYLLQKHRDLFNSQEEIRVLYAEREALREETVASEYLESELEICRLLQRINLDIINCVDLELMSLEDAINS